MADLERQNWHDDFVSEGPDEVEAEPEPDYSTNDMGLDPLYTPQEIERVVATKEAREAAATGTAAATQADAPPPQADALPPQKRKLTSKVWEHFTRGPEKKDGSYDAQCKYCIEGTFKMGNQRSTSSMKRHIMKGCKNIPSNHRNRPSPLQKLLERATPEDKL